MRSDARKARWSGRAGRLKPRRPRGLKAAVPYLLVRNETIFVWLA